MAGQLIPPPEMAPGNMAALSPGERVAAYFELLELGAQFVAAGLAQNLKPGEDVQTAFRNWYARQMEEHEADLRHQLNELSRREGSHVR